MVTIVPFTWPRREGVRQAGGRGLGTGRSHEHDSGDTHLDYPVPLLHPSSHGRPPCDREEKRGVTEGQRDSGRSQGLHSYRSHLILAHSLPWGGHGSHPAPISHGTRLETEEWVLPAQHPAHMQLKPLLCSPSQTPSLGTVKGTPSCDDPHPEMALTALESCLTPGSQAGSRPPAGAAQLSLFSPFSQLEQSCRGWNTRKIPFFLKPKPRGKCFHQVRLPAKGPRRGSECPEWKVRRIVRILSPLTVSLLASEGSGERGDRPGPGDLVPVPPPPRAALGYRGRHGGGDPQCRRHAPAPTCPWNWPRFPFPRLGSFFLALGAEAGGEGGGGGNIRCKISSSLSVPIAAPGSATPQSHYAAEPAGGGVSLVEERGEHGRSDELPPSKHLPPLPGTASCPSRLVP